MQDELIDDIIMMIRCLSDEERSSYLIRLRSLAGKQAPEHEPQETMN